MPFRRLMIMMTLFALIGLGDAKPMSENIGPNEVSPEDSTMTTTGTDPQRSRELSIFDTVFGSSDFPCEDDRRRCFNNPGFLDGYRMHLVVSGLRGRETCIEDCVPIRACADTTGYTGPFTPFKYNVCTRVRYNKMNRKIRRGWECGECPDSDSDEA